MKITKKQLYKIVRQQITILKQFVLDIGKQYTTSKQVHTTDEKAISSGTTLQFVQQIGNILQFKNKDGKIVKLPNKYYYSFRQPEKQIKSEALKTDDIERIRQLIRSQLAIVFFDLFKKRQIWR